MSKHTLGTIGGTLTDMSSVSHTFTFSNNFSIVNVQQIEDLYG